jgi:hypothetical protein
MPLLRSLLALLVLLASLAQPVLAQIPAPQMDPAFEAMHMRLYENLTQPDAVFNAQPQAASVDVGPVGAWSKFAFSSYRDGNWEIYLANGDTGAPLRLTVHPKTDSQPRLNRGATRVVFTSNRDGDYEIFSMNPDGSDLRQLTLNSATDGWPVWSPDGSQIAFESYRDGNWEIYAMNADGSNQRRLTNDASYDNTPSWTPDGSAIIWARNTPPVLYGDIMAINPDGSNRRLIKSGLVYVTNPMVAPNDYNIAYSFDPDQDGWYEVGCASTGPGGCPNGLYAFRDGGDKVDLLLGGWQPDSQALSYAALTYIFHTDGKYYLTAANINRISISGGYVDSLFNSGLDLDPDWQTTDNLPPHTNLPALPPYSRVAEVTLVAEGDDQGLAGIWRYDFQYRMTSNGPWKDACMRYSPLKSCGIGATPGFRYEYRSRAVDFAGNVEPWPAGPEYDTFTTIYLWSLSGKVTDLRGRPRPGAALSVNPPALAPATFDHQGNFHWYGASYGTQSVTLQKDGFGALPPLNLPAEKDSTALLVLPPADDLIVNGQFETTTPVGWSASSPQVSLNDTGAAHTGNHSALVSNQLVQSVTFLGFSTTWNGDAQILGDRTGRLHAIWVGNGPGGTAIYTTNKPQGGEWAAPVMLGTLAGLPQMAVSSDNTLTAVWFATLPSPGNTLHALFMSQMPEGGSWSAPVQITYSYGLTSNFNDPGPRLSADGLGGLHLAFATDMGVWYMHQPAGGSWTAPDLVQGAAWSPQIQAGVDGQVHFLWQRQQTTDTRQLNYAQRALDGSLTQETLPFSDFENYRLALNAAGNPTALVQRWRYGIYASQRLAEGGWSGPVTVKAISQNNTITLTDARFGPDGRLFAAWYEYCGSNCPVVNVVFLAVRGLDEQWSAPVRLSKDAGKYAIKLSLFIDEAGGVHGVWLVSDSPVEGGSVFYAGMTLAESWTTRVSQSVSIPAGMRKTTLSFLYLASQPLGAGASLQVLVNGNVVREFNPQVGSWAHAWADLSAYAGQTVEIGLQAHSTLASGELIVRLDEVSLGSWQEPAMLFLPILTK